MLLLSERISRQADSRHKTSLRSAAPNPFTSRCTFAWVGLVAGDRVGPRQTPTGTGQTLWPAHIAGHVFRRIELVRAIVIPTAHDCDPAPAYQHVLPKRLQQRRLHSSARKNLWLRSKLLQHRAIQQGDLRVLKLAKLRMNSTVRHCRVRAEYSAAPGSAGNCSGPLQKCSTGHVSYHGPSLWMRLSSHQTVCLRRLRIQVSSAVPVYVFSAR